MKTFCERQTEKIKELCAELDQVYAALQELHDWQNGCPLPSYEEGWGNAMAKAEFLLERRNEVPVRIQELKKGGDA